MCLYSWVVLWDFVTEPFLFFNRQSLGTLAYLAMGQGWGFEDEVLMKIIFPAFARVLPYKFVPSKSILSVLVDHIIFQNGRNDILHTIKKQIR